MIPTGKTLTASNTTDPCPNLSLRVTTPPTASAAQAAQPKSLAQATTKAATTRSGFSRPRVKKISEKPRREHLMPTKITSTVARTFVQATSRAMSKPSAAAKNNRHRNRPSHPSHPARHRTSPSTDGFFPIFPSRLRVRFPKKHHRIPACVVLMESTNLVQQVKTGEAFPLRGWYAEDSSKRTSR